MKVSSVQLLFLLQVRFSTDMADENDEQLPSSVTPLLSSPVHGSNDNGLKASASNSSPTLQATGSEERSSLSNPIVRNQVIVLFFISFLNVLIQSMISPTLLLYTNSIGVTSAQNIKPYLNSNAIRMGVPIVLNVVLTRLASTHSPSLVLSVTALMFAFSFLILLLCSIVSENIVLFVYYLSAVFMSVTGSIRVLRLAIFSKIISASERTTVMSATTVVVPAGSILGPLVWILILRYKGEAVFYDGLIVINRYTLCYLVAFFACLGMASLSKFFFPRRRDGATETNEATTNNSSAVPSTSTLTTIDITDERSRNRFIYLYFCALFTCTGLTVGIIFVMLQPLLVNVYLESDQMIGVIYEAMAVFTFLPPLLVSFLSTKLADRHLIAIGLTLMLAGVSVYLPFPFFDDAQNRSVWRAVIGYMLVYKGTAFFITTNISLSSKMATSDQSTKLIGVLMSCWTLGQSLSQVFVAQYAVLHYGQWSFIIYALPLLISATAVVSCWKWLSTSSSSSRS